MASLAEMRAKIAAADAKSARTGKGDSAIYPHWNIAEDASTLIRFLLDGDKNNSFFWVERAIIKLKFNGMIGGEGDSKECEVQVPCMEMYGAKEVCPILAEVRPWYKDESLKAKANQYWKKRSYLFQGFVRENPLAEDTPPENPIRRFIMGPQIFPIIKDALVDPELDHLPTDYVHGIDFRITKTTKGGYSDYNTSKWSRKESPLTDDELAAIEKYGLFNLSDFLPNKPGDVELKVIKEMFEASVDGQPYDVARWGQYYRPFGVNVAGSSNETKTTESAEKKAEPAAPKQDAEKVQKSADIDAKDKATATPAGTDIMAIIRARQQAKA